MDTERKPKQVSLAEVLASDPNGVALLEALPQGDYEQLLHLWRFWARPDQLPPQGDWEGWLIVTGRGWGKNKTAAEHVNEAVRMGEYGRLGLIARTKSDARDVMVEGESGILTVAQNDFRPLWEPTRHRLTWPNGARAMTYTADEPDSARGPSTDFIWGDEIATWRYPEAWDNAMFGLRLGKARWMATTTPKSTPLMKRLLKDARELKNRIHLVEGSTYENIHNLAENFKRRILGRYEGTHLARQELWAHLLDDNPDALWSQKLLERQRVTKFPPLYRMAVAVDPMGSTENPDAETGIIGGGLGEDGFGYVLEDASIHGKPHEWGKAVVALYHKLKADVVIAETNFGGDMVVSTIAAIDPRVPVQVVSASRGKYVRAEPVSTLYEQKKVYHVGYFPELEDEMRTWVPDPKQKSPNRLDALVWLFHHLMVGSKDERYGRDYGIGRGG